jgi:hypothetical protein
VPTRKDCAAAATSRCEPRSVLILAEGGATSPFAAVRIFRFCRFSRVPALRGAFDLGNSLRAAVMTVWRRNSARHG